MQTAVMDLDSLKKIGDDSDGDQAAYKTWVENTPGMENRLPKHMKSLCEVAKKEGQAAQQMTLQQMTLTDHFQRAAIKEVIIPYSNDLFKEAVI
ncbi:hypothetical protein M422DRAFT_265412 [Sphaerobolus stellatus SS14]|uniref:Uncharacterized protein n=1 Tax=Sphaerobolus stellatus (strain SS14) TaxID=990650 RepID=A0A0C9UU41_SPHS4|nr:hypothetical protein M422DRAFT_265412 [Sphaerobolus stellatus SS14]